MKQETPEGSPTAGMAMSLPVGTRLSEFELLSIIGEGGFSIVYLAYDHSLQRTVAIKEYLPGAIAFRDGEGIVRPRFEKYEGTFKTGLQSFLNEARILAQFEHPALIRIHRFWEQNGTAYMVMQYCKGRTLRKVLQDEPDRRAQEQWIKQQVIAPVLDALRLLHSKNYYHRDLSPDNIMVLDTGAPMLLDFGAARQVIGDMTQALTVILKPGFAPIEQYADDESMRQGPWTDIYGVGAVLYFVVTGKAPVASVARLVKDPLKKLQQSAEYAISPSFAQAIDHSLAVFPNDRPQSIDDFQIELSPSADPLAEAPVESRTPELETGSDSEVAGTGGVSAVGIAEAITPINASSHAPVDSVAAEPLSDEQISVPQTEQAPQPSVEHQVAGTDRVAVKQARRWPLVATAVGGLLVLGALVSWWTVKGDASTTPSDATHATDRNEQVAEAKPDVSRQPTIPETPSVTAPESPSDAAGPQGTSGTLTASTANASPPTSKDTGGAPMAAVQAGAVGSQSPAATAVSKEPAQTQIKPVDSEKTLPVKAPEIALPTTAPKVPEGTGVSGAASPTSKPSENPKTKDKDAVAELLSGTRATNTVKNPPLNPPAGGEQRTNAETKQEKPGAYIKLSVQPWGRIVIDGQDKGISPPLVRIWLPEGEHRVVIENGDLPKFAGSIKILDKKDVVLAHKF
ncbi:serine/threonine protein kinase [Comamonas odontotermitis]|uniref:Serine/threonine protein kinase n=1 Tax=Comamonas odontotermitis TaxID=379895 RepID=A0ABR6RK00_9BURK|nr:serine/threonine-protein kinase [Comamonas odontotermitis]MBB6579515.1 serine/threonine protein kinase [Comamonas odontotermitis]